MIIGKISLLETFHWRSRQCQYMIHLWRYVIILRLRPWRKLNFARLFRSKRLCRFLGLVEPIFWRSFLFPVCLFAASSYLECSGCLALRVVDKTLTQDKRGGTTGQAFLTSTALQFPASSFPYTYYYTESDAYHTVMIAIIIGNFLVVIEYERR